MKAKQFNLFDFNEDTQSKSRYNRTAHGGNSAKGKRKLERPLSTKGSIHLILKSDKAVGKYGFLLPKNNLLVHRILQKQANKFGVKIARMANVGNHLHLKLRIASRENFQKFLKSVTAMIARAITGACRGKPFGRFWQGLAFTRVLKTGKEEWILDQYIERNRKQARMTAALQLKFLQELLAWEKALGSPPT